MFVSVFCDFGWGSAISGMAGLVNGIIGSSATGKANKRNIQFAKESQQEQERFAREMFDAENSYNDPSAVMDRLAKAGINPAAYWSQSSGTAGMASGDSSVSPVTPNIQPVPSPIAGLVGNAPFEALKQLQEIQGIKRDNERKGIENSRLADQIEADIQEKMSNANVNSTKAEYQKLINNGFPEYRAAELRKMGNEAYAAGANGDLALANEILATWESKAKKWHVEEELPLLKQQYEKGINLLVEQANTEKKKQSNLDSGSALNYAGAANNYSQVALNKAKTLTEDELRPHIVEAQKIGNKIAGYQATQEKAKAHYIDRQLSTDLQIAIKSSLLLDGQKELLLKRIEYAEKENDWYEFNQVVNAFSSVANALSGFAPTKTSTSSSISHTSNGFEKTVNTRTSRLP